MAESVAAVVADLEDEDFYLLSGIEQGMRFSEWVQREKLPAFSGLTREEVEYRIDQTADRELIERQTIQYEGYQLTTRGYDVLALRAFAERDTVEGMGAPLGVGKESDVYEVRSYQALALKFHREGYTNFREVHRERDYTSDRDHTSWLYTARVAAEREYDALETLYPDVSVPRPIDQNRHAIVMEKMDGVELHRAALEPEQVAGVLDLVLQELAEAYDHGLVHADISEHNLFVSDDGITVFDWPQAVATDHENAETFLERDVENIVSYLERKYPGELDAPERASITNGIESGSFESIEHC